MDPRVLFPSPPTTPVTRLDRAEVDDVLDRLFAAPSIDAGQVPMHVPHRLDSGEMRLALAILEDALRCVLRHHDSPINEQRHAAREALEWMRSDDDAPPFSFVRVCQLFDLEPDWIRRTVRRFVRDSRTSGVPAGRTSCAA
jgi:hypothetical protein